MRKRILFICLGNICRSPAAEGVMKAIVKESGLSDEVYVDSAGIGNWHVGELPDARMREHGRRRGYDFNSRARQFSAADFDNFDYIIVMDEQNYRDVCRQARSQIDQNKVLRMRDFFIDYTGCETVPDPYYGGPEGFELALDLIEDGCRGLMDKILK